MITYSCVILFPVMTEDNFDLTYQVRKSDIDI